MGRRLKKPIASEPWKPAPYEDADHHAIKALAAGVANEGQQKRALKWIVENLCGTYEPSYRSTSDRDTSFAEGKRHIGLQLVKHVNLNLSSK